MCTGRATSRASVIWKSWPPYVQPHTTLVCTDGHIEVTDVGEMSVEHHLLDKLKRRLRVAKEIDAKQHRANKATHDKKWVRATADALDIELDSDYSSECAPPFYSLKFSFHRSNQFSNGAVRSNKTRDSKLVQLKSELKELLNQPLIARGVSTRYITSGSRPVASAILAGECECFRSLRRAVFLIMYRPRGDDRR